MLAVFATVAALVLVWRLPSGGTGCDQLDACRLSVELDLGSIEDEADDWHVAGETGIALSPDEESAAVVLISTERQERRLAMFSTSTGELVGEYAHGTHNWFENPVFSNDGTRLAAVGATLVDDAGSGSVIVWDRATAEIVDELWAWEQDESDSSEDHGYRWFDCQSLGMGFSNDGRYLVCHSGDAAEIGGSTTVKGYGYEPGFNTLPATSGGFLTGRVIFDPEYTRADDIRVSGDGLQVEINLADRRAGALVELDEGRGWDRTSIALSGDSDLSLVARHAEVGGWWRLLPPITHAKGSLVVIDNLEATVIAEHRIDAAPVAVRFSADGTSYLVATDDLTLMIFTVDDGSQP